MGSRMIRAFDCSGDATPGRARSNDLAGRSTALAPALTPPCLLLCFISVIVWPENKYFTTSNRWPLYLFYFDRETISAALMACVLRATTKKRSSTFWEKKCIRVTWLEDVLISKWPGSFAALAPQLFDWYWHWWPWMTLNGAVPLFCVVSLNSIA